VTTAPPVEGRVWFNTGPVPWNDLKNRVVVLVFWTIGCESSLVQLRQIQNLVESHRFGVHAIGVHTPKFPRDEDPDLVQAVLLQHRITIPIVHDPDAITWNRYNPTGWPSTIVINGKGHVVGAQGGSNDIELIDEAVTTAKTTAEDLDTAPYQPVRPPMPSSPLVFPTSAAVLASGQLIVSDSGHDRLVVISIDEDRREATANCLVEGFNAPGDVVVTPDDMIYVAEPLSGSVTQIDLEAKSRRLCVYDLVSPTGLEVDIDGSVAICDSGSDTIYRMVDGGPYQVIVGAIAGSGHCGTADGPANRAELGQPYGIARTDAGLVFCDAASNRIRLLTNRGKVASITKGSFHDCGLIDGPAHKAKMQRPTSLVQIADGSLIVVDSGNGRLRRLAGKHVTTLGLKGLNQPTGLCVLPDGHLIVADTGNHRLVVVSPNLDAVWPLPIRGLNQPEVSEPADSPRLDEPMSPAV